MAVITDPKKIGGLLRAIDGYDGYIITKCALQLAPFVFVRPGELRHAEWPVCNDNHTYPFSTTIIRPPRVLNLRMGATEVATF